MITCNLLSPGLLMTRSFTSVIFVPTCDSGSGSCEVVSSSSPSSSSSSIVSGIRGIFVGSCTTSGGVYWLGDLSLLGFTETEDKIFEQMRNIVSFKWTTKETRWCSNQTGASTSTLTLYRNCIVLTESDIILVTSSFSYFHQLDCLISGNTWARRRLPPPHILKSKNFRFRSCKKFCDSDFCKNAYQHCVAPFLIL